VKLLVVEDDVDVGLALTEELRHSYAVDWAVNKTTGLYQARINPYDLLIFDLTLPDGNGLELCNQVRADGISTPILMLTATNSAEDKVAALDAGADDYVTKPFHLPELKARIRALLRRPEQVIPKVVEIDDLKVDLVNRTVSRGNQDIILRRKQFDLLEFLLRHPNQVLSRGTILEHVWEGDADGFSNIVDVHIKYLRDKIDKPFSRHLIHTVSGVGYKLQKP